MNACMRKGSDIHSLRLTMERTQKNRTVRNQIRAWIQQPQQTGETGNNLTKKILLSRLRMRLPY